MIQSDEFPLPGLPRPDADTDSAPFWDGLADGRLLAPRCRACERFHFPSTPTCPHCGASAMDWRALTGTPVVYSWIIVHRATHPDIPVPYAVVLGEFPEGVRIPGNMASDDAEKLTIGAPLTAMVSTRDGVNVVAYRHA